MASEGRKRPRGSATRAAGEEWSSNARKLLERPPQFIALAKVAEGQAPATSPSQQKFLEGFASGLAEAAAKDEDASQPAAADAAARPEGRRARPKEET